jgi:hypothetical protein
MPNVDTMEKKKHKDADAAEKSIFGNGPDTGEKSAAAKKLNEKYNLPSTYEILIGKPLPELNSSYAKAFEVLDTKQKGFLYALILPNNLPIRFSTLQRLRKVFHNSLANIIDAGFTDVDGGKFGNFAIVCERPIGLPLDKFIATQERGEREDGSTDYFLAESVITSKIVEPINDLLKTLNEEGLSHGSINHSKIFVEDDEGVPKIKLLEPVSEPCGLSQYHQYETIHRAQATPLGKGENTIVDDYFALGTLVFYCMFGDLPDTKSNVTDFLSKRLAVGTYTTYMGNTEVTSRMVDLLRGLLNDITDERWGYQQVSEWVKGKRFNLIRPTFRKESVRSYLIDNAKHFTRRSLANYYYQNWEDASQDLRTKKIMKWLELSVGKQNQSEEIGSLINTTGGEKTRSRKDDDELIAKTLLILDPVAPIRFRNISAHVDGLGVVLANAWTNRNQSELQEIREIFSLNLADFKVVKDIFTDRSSERWLLQRLNTFINIDAYGFGIERCLYDLNPGLPCQSQLLSNQFVIDLGHLIHYLNDNAERLAEFEPVDRHVAAFISGRLEMSKPLQTNIAGASLTRIHKEKIAKLTLLYYAQKRMNINRLTGLTNWLVNNLEEDFSSLINGQTLKQDFLKDLNKAGKSGSISNILEVLTSGGYFSKNRNGFAEAKGQYTSLSNSVRLHGRALENAKKYKTFYLTGLYLAKVFSILVFVLVISAVSL